MEEWLRWFNYLTSSSVTQLSESRWDFSNLHDFCTRKYLTLHVLQESDNEMVISDVDTGEFIAKKIIYD